MNKNALIKKIGTDALKPSEQEKETSQTKVASRHKTKPTNVKKDKQRNETVRSTN